MAIEDTENNGSSEKSPLLQQGKKGKKKHYLDIVPELQVNGSDGKSDKNFRSDDIPPFKPPSPTILIVGKRQGRLCRRFWGIIFAIMASVFLSLTTLLAKLLIGYHPFNVAIWRFEGILIPSLPVLIFASCVHEEPVFESIQPIWERGKFKTFVLLFVS